MKTLISFIVGIILVMSLSACDGGGGSSKPGNGGADSGGGENPKPLPVPSPSQVRECGAVVIEKCQLFNLTDQELAAIREQVVVIVPADVNEQNYPGMKLVIARVHILLDFIGTYYRHADMELRPQEEKLYVNYFQSIKWK